MKRNQPTNTNPFEQGQADARAGRPVSASPYATASRDWTRWFCGYTAAKSPVNAPRITSLSTAGGQKP